MTKAQRDIKRELRVLSYAQEIGNFSKACRYFGISREAYYQWKRVYEQRGDPFLYFFISILCDGFPVVVRCRFVTFDSSKCATSALLI